MAPNNNIMTERSVSFPQFLLVDPGEFSQRLPARFPLQFIGWTWPMAFPKPKMQRVMKYF